MLFSCSWMLICLCVLRTYLKASANHGGILIWTLGKMTWYLTKLPKPGVKLVVNFSSLPLKQKKTTRYLTLSKSPNTLKCTFFISFRFCEMIALVGISGDSWDSGGLDYVRALTLIIAWLWVSHLTQVKLRFLICKERFLSSARSLLTCWIH